jgi:oligopeptide transport system ATP-binding protein
MTTVTMSNTAMSKPTTNHSKTTNGAPSHGSAPLLKVENLKKHFPIKSGLLLRQTGTVYAVDGVSFELAPGKTLGLVGESGCGKSTLGRTIIRIYDPTSGTVEFNGTNTAGMHGKTLHAMRRDMQMIFQDPYGSLNPRHTVGTIVSRPLEVFGIGTSTQRQERVSELLRRVGLGDWAAGRYPHEFSGGQRQRIAIARAIAVEPKLVIADEPVSALDVSVRAQILNLMQDLQDEMKMAYLFIAHDLAVVRHMSDEVAVMYLGRIVEKAPRDQLYGTPLHPYTKALMLANPIAGVGRRRGRGILKGDVPSPVAPPSGCHFHPRCPLATDECRMKVPQLRSVPSRSDASHVVACHRAEET